MDQTNDASHKRVLKAAKTINELRKAKHTIPVMLTGKIVNGKVKIDQHVLDEIAKTHVNAKGVFVAVNAPFDPQSAAL